jgi:Fe2+ or Zn2+ uptake regulation protein
MLPKILRAFKKILQSGGSASLFLAGSGLLSGCATLGLEPTKPPVTVSEVVQMTQEGAPAETIIHRMRETNTVYRLNAADLAQLHDRGVADSVLNDMQQTYLESVRREQNRAAWDDWGLWRDYSW